jgi:uncharacterized protein
LKLLQDYRVIDCGITPPFKEFFLMPDYMHHYRRIYKASEERIIPMQTMEWTPESFIKCLDDDGINMAVITARDIETSYDMKIADEACADLVNKFPDRLIGFAGVDPLKGKKAIKGVEHAVKDLGLKGVTIWAYEYNLPASDHAYYPIYEKCLELGAIVGIESSMHFHRNVRMDVCHPCHLDYIAVDFPELKIIGVTPGFPWVPELVAIAWRHPNIYIKTGMTRPKYLATPGYATLLQYTNTILQDRVLFASGWPAMPIKRSVEEICSLPLKDEVKRKILYQNAAALFGITK